MPLFREAALRHRYETGWGQIERDGRPSPLIVAATLVANLGALAALWFTLS